MTDWQFLEAHPLADLFPEGTVEEMAGLVESIQRYGFDPTHPVVLYEGRILDGRRRTRACAQLRGEGYDVTPLFLNFDGTSPLQFVLQENLHRRHLTATDRMILGVEIERWEAVEAAQRQAKLNRAELTAKLPEANKGEARERAAKIAGVSARYISDGKRIKAEQEDLYRQMQAGEMTLQEAKREAKRRARPVPKAAGALPDGKFDVVYADPPWRYDFSEVDAWAVENSYPTEEATDLCAWGERVRAISTPKTALFLWATSPKLSEAIALVSAWGFTYKTSMVWVKHKNQAGMGYWTRVGHELLLIAAREQASPPPVERRFPSVIEAGKGAHSEKPEEARKIIERMFPEARRLEMFARGVAPDGWTFWGNEVTEGGQ